MRAPDDLLFKWVEFKGFGFEEGTDRLTGTDIWGIDLGKRVVLVAADVAVVDRLPEFFVIHWDGVRNGEGISSCLNDLQQFSAPFSFGLWRQVAPERSTFSTKRTSLRLLVNDLHAIEGDSVDHRQ
ncbi:MAG: hypothetical protein C4344_07785 [Acidimicrobiia bacterium]